MWPRSRLVTAERDGYFGLTAMLTPGLRDRGFNSVPHSSRRGGWHMRLTRVGNAARLDPILRDAASAARRARGETR